MLHFEVTSPCAFNSDHTSYRASHIRGVPQNQVKISAPALFERYLLIYTTFRQARLAILSFKSVTPVLAWLRY
jgi:hypothetical protein